MLTSIKKLLALDGSPKPQDMAAPEYIFLLDLERKKEYLLDLRAILRTPGSRRALPRLHKLETTVTRNDHRIRIPHDVMPALVREMISVERRIPQQSPLRELMNAVPGLVASMRVDPTPTSVLMGGHETLPGELNTREMNAAARGIGAALAQKIPAAADPTGSRPVPPSTRTTGMLPGKPAAGVPGKAPAKPEAHAPGKPLTKPQAPPPGKPGSPPSGKPAGPNQVKTVGKPDSKPSVPAAAPKAAPPGVKAGTKKPAETIFGNTEMSASEQQRFLQESSAQLQAAVLRTSELADGDLAAYFDLCLMSGEYEKIIDSLLPRVAEAPSAWAWIRLLNAAEAAKKMEFDVWCSNFKSWITREHPALLPDMLAKKTEDLKFGVHRAGLEDLERRELKT